MRSSRKLQFLLMSALQDVYGRVPIANVRGTRSGGEGRGEVIPVAPPTSGGAGVRRDAEEPARHSGRLARSPRSAPAAVRGLFGPVIAISLVPRGAPGDAALQLDGLRHCGRVFFAPHTAQAGVAPHGGGTPRIDARRLARCALADSNRNRTIVPLGPDEMPVRAARDHPSLPSSFRSSGRVAPGAGSPGRSKRAPGGHPTQDNPSRFARWCRLLRCIPSTRAVAAQLPLARSCSWRMSARW